MKLVCGFGSSAGYILSVKQRHQADNERRMIELAAKAQLTIHPTTEYSSVNTYFTTEKKTKKKKNQRVGAQSQMMEVFLPSTFYCVGQTTKNVILKATILQRETPGRLKKKYTLSV